MINTFFFSHCYSPGEIYIYQSITGNILIEKNVFPGTDVVFIPGIKVCNNSIGAAEDVVTHNVEKHTKIRGVPAKIINKINESFNS